MLPFQKRDEAALSMPVEHMKRESDEDSDHEFDSLESAAEDLISAIHSKKTKSVASALRAAFEICESEPHEEAEHG